MMHYEKMMDWFDGFYKTITRQTILGVGINHAIIEIHGREAITIVLDYRRSFIDVLNDQADDRRIVLDLPLTRVREIMAGRDEIFLYEFQWEDELVGE